MKKVKFDKDVIEPVVKRCCECTGCNGCAFLPCGSSESPRMWTDIQCKNKDCMLYVCMYCFETNENMFCNYCLRK